MSGWKHVLDYKQYWCDYKYCHRIQFQVLLLHTVVHVTCAYILIQSLPTNVPLIYVIMQTSIGFNGYSRKKCVNAR